jgi:DNA repair exonuclease SbcCD ATPase subunit
MESNYVNLKNSFKILVETIKSYGTENCLCVIAGDIFESKSFLTTDNIFQWKAITVLLQRECIKTLILIGNHDYNINSELVKDNVTLLTTNYSYIKVVNETQIINGEVFGDSNLEFYIFSPIDKKIPQIQNNDKIKIALLHESVNAAKYDNGQVISGARFNAGDLSEFDYVLLGDIHKQQYLSERIAYCGSFVQKNKGESIHKGYILWDLYNGTSQFHSIPLKEVYIKIQAENNKCTLIDVAENQLIRYTALFYKNCTYDYIEDLKSQMEKKYKYINRIVNNTQPTLDNSEIKIDVTNEDIKKTYNHENLIEEILNGDIRTKDIISFHKENMKNRVDVNHTTYKLNYMCWSNIYCYGPDNYINFRDFNNDLVMLSGKNKEGKSSIIDILIRILYNEAIRGPKDEIVNKSKNQGNIKLSFNIGDDEYIIEQIYNKSAKTQFHRLYKNDVNISKDTVVQTYTYLKSLIGNYHSFVNLTTALQNRKFLVDMTQKDFIDLLTEITNIDILKDIEDDTKKEVNLTKSLIKKYAKDIEELPEIKIEVITQLKETYDKLTDSRNKCQTNLEKINGKLIDLHKDYNNTEIPDDLEDQIKEVVSQIKAFDIERVKEYKSLPLEDYKEHINNVSQNLWLYEKKLKTIPESTLLQILENDYSKLNSDTKNLIINKIKEIKDTVHKPKITQFRDVAVLEGIISNYMDMDLFPIEKCEINQLVRLNRADRDDELLANGLPNYKAIEKDIKKLETQIASFKSNFGSLEFNEGCGHCNQNKINIYKIFNVKTESQRLLDLQNTLRDRENLKERYENAQLYNYNTIQNEIYNRNLVAKKANKEIVNNNIQYKDALNELEELKNKQSYDYLQKLEKKLNKYKEKDIQEVKWAYDKLVYTRSYLELNISYLELTELHKIKKGNGSRLVEINKLNGLLEKNKNWLNEANVKLTSLLDEFRVKQSQFDKMNDLIKEHANQISKLEFLNLYFSVVNCKSGIPSYILKNTCRKIQDSCNDILSKVADFTIEITFDKDIKIYTIENDVAIPAQMGSGMQKFVLDLIFRITLTEISSISCPKTLFVDEGFGSLDKENFIGIANTLQKLKTNFDSLIIISHISELNSYVDKTIKIAKRGHLSNVQFGELANYQKEVRLLLDTNVNNKRNKEFKDSVKSNKIIKNTEEQTANEKKIAQYLIDNGGIEKVLFNVNDGKVFCNGCDKEYNDRNKFIEKHLAAATHTAKHTKYLMSLL